MNLEQILQSGNYELIDVREPMELMMDGEIEGAKNIPLGEIENRESEILDLEKPVILSAEAETEAAKLWNT